MLKIKKKKKIKNFIIIMFSKKKNKPIKSFSFYIHVKIHYSTIMYTILLYKILKLTL